MMYSSFSELSTSAPEMGDQPQINNYNGSKSLKFLVRKSEGEIEVGDDILITDQILTNAVDPEATFYLNSADFLNGDVAGDVSNYSLSCVECDLEIESVTVLDNRSVTIQFLGNAFVTYPLIVPDAVPAVAAEDPVITITSDTAFVSEALVEDTDNWTFTPGTTGLTLASVVWVDANTAELHCTGTVVAGNLIIQANSDLYAGHVRSLSIDCDTSTEAYTTENDAAGTITLTVRKEAVLGASADLEMTYEIGDAASVVAFSHSGMAGSLDIYIYFDDFFYHFDTVTVAETDNFLVVSDENLRPQSKYGFKYTSTLEADTGSYFIAAIYES